MYHVGVARKGRFAPMVSGQVIFAPSRLPFESLAWFGNSKGQVTLQAKEGLSMLMDAAPMALEDGMVTFFPS